MKDFLHKIHFTTDFSKSKATALEIANFLEKLDGLVKDDLNLEVASGCFGFYYPDGVEDGIEVNRAELLSIIDITSPFSFEALLEDWFGNKYSKYYQLISQFNGLKIDIYCSETNFIKKQRILHNYDILMTPIGVTFLSASENLVALKEETLTPIEVGHFTTNSIDENGEEINLNKLSDKYQALQNTTDWIDNSSREEFLSTKPK